ncbi:MAG TPA: crosslink repair DNA glycosylase YcaQ family protein [Mycobacteriales bacterium]|nr:crosslink repair DNA glycosylase YcaQ family protein [Mycobacteriales bacterium]
MTVHELSRQDARRIAVRAQLLDANRPTDLLDTVRHLTMLQLDPTAAVAPNADLVAWTRLGSAYEPAELVEALDKRELLELRAMIRPAADIALYRAEMAELMGLTDRADWRPSVQRWIAANDGCRRDILARLTEQGPLPSRDLPDTCAVPWQSTGWTNNRNVIQLLACMARRGEVAIAGRRGRDRLWDLASRVYPDEPVVPLEEAARRRNERRLRALGIARARGQECPVEPWDVGEVGEPAVVAGVKGEWRVDPAQLGQPFAGRVALLSPFDRLVHDRKRMAEIFDFDYQLEMYKPVKARRWGYFALPILSGDRLVGKLDATADRKAGVLRINAVHEDVPFDKKTTAAVRDEIDDLARWLQLDVSRV